MQIAPFSIARLPRIEFGQGKLSTLTSTIKKYGNKILLVTGRQSIEKSNHWQSIIDSLEQNNCNWQQVRITHEPSPEMIDNIVGQFRDKHFDAVIGIGGGSVLDAAKAIAGLLLIDHSIMDFLEGVGPELTYPGPAVPFIAIPTTAGTGSEATKNAVLSKQGKDGFKKSFRDDQLVAEVAIIDPDLLSSCPPSLIAANGMDALTQIMESFVSTRSNTLTDALAVSGLRSCRDGLIDWYQQKNNQSTARSSMAYASLVSGINLAQTGLGSVHGLAAPLGAFFPVPHGAACGTLLASATRINIETMLTREPDNPALEKYARIAVILCNKKFRQQSDALTALINLLEKWTNIMQLKKLGAYGISQKDHEKITQHSRGSSMKTNPVLLTDDDIMKILEERT
ncbi:MAG: iron-containing alcohol dehydrogenase [Gammaproteobacteria bacterium]|nr:iron-containing alcohol dehydrogenase [Gammaproteobacteria bacterium]